MKTTLSTTYRSLNSEMSRLSSTLENLRNQAATGKKLLRPSDDPAAIRPVLSARSQIRATDRFVASLSTAGDRLANQDAYLDQAENLMVRAKEITISAINGSMSDADLNTLADEIGYIKTEMLGVANAQVGGQYIFAGYQEDTRPFVEVDGVIKYQGDSNVKRLEASSGEYVQTNIPGSELFMRHTDLDGDGVMESTQQDIFSMLTDLERAIRGESGEIYNGNEMLPTADIGVVSGTPVAADGSGVPLTDLNGDTVPLVHAGKPISMQPVLKDNGDRMTIAEYSQKYSIQVHDIDGNNISMSTAPMYLHANGDIPAFNTAETPILAYTASDGTPAAISLLNADGSPIQLKEVPDLQTMLSDLENGADHLRSKRGLMGNNAARLESSIMHLEGVRIDLEQILSRYEDADILDVLTEIIQTETAFEGALKVTGQVSRLSILDYM